MIRLFNQYFPVRKILFFAGECLFIALAVIISLIFHGEFDDYLTHPLFLIIKIFLILTVYQVSLFLSDFYSSGTSWTYKKMTHRLLTSLIIAFCIIRVLYALTPENIFTTKVLTTILVFALLFLLPWRFLYSWFINLSNYKKKVLILGSGKLARDIAREIIKERELSLNVVGFISNDPTLQGISIVNPKVIGTTRTLSKIVDNGNIDKIIVAMEERRGNIPLDDLLRYKSYGIKIEDGVNFYEKATNKLLVEYINPSNLIFCDGFKLSYITMLFKRTYDIVLSSIGLIIASPLFLITSLLIKLESKGPIFFKQERVGRNRKSFYIYKFRSMQNDAEKKTGPIMSFKGDCRVTKLGKIIRKTRLDEIPQLWNVLNGSMSFVGPRPERPMFVEKFKKNIPFYTQRFSLRPGLTGWAQIRSPYASNFEQSLDKLSYELYYLKNFSLLFDLTIILRTIKVVLFARGSA
ncbi:MAG: TIGR03013 family PEP-CTERM/XrtA system glycosyltransferase [Deltaproteobacteria bacterium]|nr:TIGR03013 family PEP-CTERM/XrtA system glycosyltransferase [Deltaproteobacteria bacterium]